jgi:hypothetical protein
MPKIEFPVEFGDRRFQIWSFEVSHSVLLLYCPPTKEQPTRIDITFRAIDEFRLRQGLVDLSVDLLDGSDPRLADLGLTLGLWEHVFTVSAKGFPHGYVVAGSMFTAEYDLSDANESISDETDLERHLLKKGYFQP